MENKIQTLTGELNSYQDNNTIINTLKMHRAFKKLGVKKYIAGNQLKDDTIFDELTICDNFDTDYINYNYNVVDSRSEGYRHYNRQWREFKGEYRRSSIVYVDTGRSYVDEGCIELKLFEDTDNEMIIGQYFPKRNMILLNMNFSYNKDVANNTYIPECLKLISNWIDKYDIKTVDNSDFRSEIVIRLFNRVLEQSLIEEKEKFRKLMITDKDLSSRLAANWSERKSTMDEIESKTKFVKNVKDGLNDQIEKIKELPFVKNVRLEIEGIKMDTNYVTTMFRGSEVKLGEFELTICPNEIKIKNKIPIIDEDYTYHHPHISGDHVCYGTKGDVIPRLLGNLELKKAVHFIWLYLNGINAGDTYISVSRWNYARDNGDDCEGYGEYND